MHLRRGGGWKRGKKKKTWRLHHIGAPASSPPAQRVAPPYRCTHAHADTPIPSFPQLPPLYTLPPGRRLLLCLRPFLVVSWSPLSSFRRAGPPPSRSKVICAMACAFQYYGPSLGFPLVLALRLLYEGKAFCWLTFELYNDVEHYAEWVFPTPGPFPVLALRLQYGNMAYRWLISFIIWATLLFSTSPRLRGGLPSTMVASYPSRLCRWWTVHGSLLWPLHFFTFSLESHGVRRPAPGPRIALSLRAPSLGCLLLGAPLPVPSLSCFSL